MGSIVCNDNHTVTISIMNVIDIAKFNESDWRIDDKEECQPKFSGQTVTFTNLLVGNCSSTSEERDNDILYVFKIRVLPTGSNPIQAVDHMFDASCVYLNNNTVTASFIPLTQRADNATGKMSQRAGMTQWLRSGESARLPPMWPGSDSGPVPYVAEFVDGSCLAPRVFLQVFLPP